MLKEILTIERYIEQVRDGGDEIPKRMFAPLKEIVTKTLLSGVLSNDRHVKLESIRVSEIFNSLDIEHQKRVLNAMSKI